MKRSIFVGVLLLMYSSVVAQSERKVIGLTQEFKLKIGESAEAQREGLKVEFDSVVDDSRCPTGVTCVWAGNAKILLKVKKDDAQVANVELNTNINPKTSQYLGYEFRLKELRPYPEADRRIKTSDYEVSLTVHKL